MLDVLLCPELPQHFTKAGLTIPAVRILPPLVATWAESPSDNFCHNLLDCVSD